MSISQFPNIVLVGGLGNNLFQLNFFFRFSSLSSSSNVFYLFDTPFSIFLRRLRGVSSYNINPLIYKLVPNAKFVNLGYFSLAALALSRFFSKKIFSHLWMDQSCKDVTIFQSKVCRSYFMNDIPISDYFVSRIRDVLEIGDTLIPRICLHMRFNDSSFKALPSDYYKRALDYALLYDSSLKVYVISNDREKVLQYLSFLNSPVDVTIISGAIQDDFIFMSQSSFLVCSNSTFSWWASEVSNSSQTIISPCYTKFGKYRFSPLSLKHRLFLV